MAATDSDLSEVAPWNTDDSRRSQLAGAFPRTMTEREFRVLPPLKQCALQVRVISVSAGSDGAQHSISIEDRYDFDASRSAGLFSMQ